jgi:hypothetical protein
MSVALADHLIRTGGGPAPRRRPADLGAPPDRCGPGDGGGGHNDGRGPDPGSGPSPVRFATTVDFVKEDVFEICAALALGESLLRRLGHDRSATRLAGVFDVVESRLAARQFVAPSSFEESSSFCS